MVMSRDPGFNFENFYFSPNFILNFRKLTEFGGEIGSRTKKLQAKSKTRGGKHPLPPVLFGLTLFSRVLLLDMGPMARVK